MRHQLSFLSLLLLLTSCQTPPVSHKPVYDGGLTYPVTQIDLGSGLQLRHLAGRPCEHASNEHPAVGSDGERTCSIYELTETSDKVVLTAPSMLFDPQYAEAEFEAYHRENDHVSAHVSPSGQSILIVEDRSPTYPRRAQILLQRDSEGRWSWTDLVIPSHAREPEELNASSMFPGFLDVVSITDSHVIFGPGRANLQPFRELARSER